MKFSRTRTRKHKLKKHNSKKHNSKKHNSKKHNSKKHNSKKHRMSGGAPPIVGVVLDNKSQDYLKTEEFDHTGFNIYNSCHHVTIRFGKGLLPGDPEVGTPVQIVCDKVGFNGQAKALHVQSITSMANEPITFAQDESNNKMLHITVRHLDKNDAVKSNEITDWTPEKVVLLGKVSLATDFKWNPNNF